MAFGNSVMARFSEESVPLDSAYESLIDDQSELDAFMDIICEGAEYDPYDVDDVDEDEYDECDDDECDDEDECDDDEYCEDDEECPDGYCDDEDADVESCREAFDSMTPHQKYLSFCKMVNNNPRFSPEKKKETIENYEKNHPDAVAEPASESLCYDKAEAYLCRADQLLAEIVGDAYDEPEYDEPSLSDHAEYASKLSTGMSRLNEPLPGINNFAGDTQAPFAASLRTHYARESAIEDIDDADYAYQDALDAIESAIDDVDPEDAYQDAVDAIESALSPTDESDSDLDVEDDFDADDIDQGLENCKNALESMIADLDALELENN